MLQLTCRIRLGMDITDLLHLQAAFQADRVIQPPADKEDVMRVHNLRREPLQPLFFLQHPADLVRDCCQRFQVSGNLFLRNLSPDRGQLHCQHIHGNQLGTVGLGCRYGNLRPGQRIQCMFRLPGNRGADHIDHCQGHRPAFLCHAQGCQAVRGFPALADYNHQGIRRHGNTAVPVFGCQFHTHRNLCQVLNHILGRHTHMPCGTAGYNIDPVDTLQVLIRQSGRIQRDPPVLYQAVQRIPHGLGLLMNLLEHEMLIAVLLCCCRVPGDLRQRQLHLIPVQVVELYFPGRDPAHLQVVDIINVPCILQDRRHIRRQERLALRRPDDQR